MGTVTVGKKGIVLLTSNGWAGSPLLTEEVRQLVRETNSLHYISAGRFGLARRLMSARRLRQLRQVGFTGYVVNIDLGGGYLTERSVQSLQRAAVVRSLIVIDDGNAYRLMAALHFASGVGDGGRSQKISQIMQDANNNGVPIIGIGAGSVVLGQTLAGAAASGTWLLEQCETMEWGSPGLGVVPFSILPHAQRVRKLPRNWEDHYTPIADCRAIKVLPTGVPVCLPELK